MQTNFGCCLIDGKLEDKKKKKSTKKAKKAKKTIYQTEVEFEKSRIQTNEILGFYSPYSSKIKNLK